MTINSLNDISKIYLKQVFEQKDDSYLETNLKKRQSNNEKSIAAMKKTKGYADMVKAARKHFDETAKPDYLDFDKDGNKKESMKKAIRDRSKQKVEEAKKQNDGNLANNYPPYDKVTRGDVIAGALGKDEMGGKKKKVTKEGYSNWREDLIEVSELISKNKKERKIAEKKVDNKIKINPNLNLGESIKNLGGTLIEMIEIDEFDYIIESVYSELFDEGYEEDDIENALEYALTEATVTYVHDTPTMEKKKEGLLTVARKKLSGAKKYAAKLVAKGARKVAKGALGVAHKIEKNDKKPSPAHTKTRTASTYRGSGVGTREKVSSGSYQAPKTTKNKVETPTDPWEGSYKTSTKPSSKPKAKPKAKTKTTHVNTKTTKPSTKSTKGKGKAKPDKLDDLLASIRSEQIQIDEKTLTSLETKEKERIIKSMKDKSADFEKRYPGRGKEVMYATATKLAKKIAEQSLEIEPKNQQSTSQPEKPNPAAVAKQKQLVQIQKKQAMDRLAQLSKGIPITA